MNSLSSNSNTVTSAGIVRESEKLPEPQDN